MNFIPYLYQTEALKTYLSQLDLYKDNIRDIDIDYDGEDENGFDIYYYHFRNDSTYLSLGFEKNGRGLVYIDNPDYQIQLSLSKHKVIHNSNNLANLRIENKKDKPIQIQVSGNNNKNILCGFNQSFIVNKDKELHIPFYIEKSQNEQDPGKTHPSLDIDVFINKQKANFKCGLITKDPLAVKLNITELMHAKNKTYKGYLDLENNLDESETFFIHFPKSNVDFQKDIQLTLNKNEKKSITVPYRLNAYGCYKEDLIIKYGDSSFKSRIRAMFKGVKESFICNLDKEILLVSANSIARYNKDSHNLNFSNDIDGTSDIAFMSPKIGMPYSLEFNNYEPNIKYVSDHKMIVEFKSQSFTNVILNMHIENSLGLLEVTYELINKGEKRNLSLSIPIHKSLSHSILPYGSKLLEVKGYGTFIANLNTKMLDEPWIYNKQLNIGFSWPNEVDMNVSDWHLTFDLENIQLDTNQSYMSKPFIVSTIHPNLKSFRHYISSKDDRELISYLELDINGFNPFIKEHAKARLINHRKAQIEGTITNNGMTYEIGQYFDVRPGFQSFRMEMKDRIIKQNRLLFNVNGKVKTNQDKGVYCVDNGLISFKADINHSDSIYSLMFDGKEWIDSNYPEPKGRAWWASFVGGITQRIQGIQDIVAIKEKREISFVKQTDNHDNDWTGLKIITNYQSDPILKGVVTENYYMTLPGVPLIYSYTKIINKSGKLIKDKFMNRRYTLNLDRDQGRISFFDSNTEYKVGDLAVDIKVDQSVCLKSSRKHNINIYGHINDYIFDSQKEYIMFFAERKMTIPDQETRIFNGDFLFFTENEVKKEDLKLFNYIDMKRE
jgi:hypothetical protein